MTLLLGLTGSIGMGKSTTAAMFADFGVDVWDADAAVHQMYAEDGVAVALIAEIAPSAVIHGAVSRPELKTLITQDPTLLGQIEKIVHPLVAQDRADFIEGSQTDILLFDIPLLYETGADQWLDYVVCVDVDAETQKSRILGRRTMTEKQLTVILNKQMPNDEKCARADFVIPTNSLDEARAAVHYVVETLRGT